jgi:hypothetical protein
MIHNRGLVADRCPNCKHEKRAYYQLADDIAETSVALFCLLARYFIKTVYVWIQKREQKNIVAPLPVTDVLRLCSSSDIFNRLRILSGARELDFIVTFKPLPGRN